MPPCFIYELAPKGSEAGSWIESRNKLRLGNMEEEEIIANDMDRTGTGRLESINLTRQRNR
jgi:hypothetical protein